MTLRAAAVVPSAPLLVPALAGGGAPIDEDLRGCTLAAVRGLLDGGDGGLVVVGAAPRTGPWAGTWDWRGFGVAQRGGGGPALPLALGVGAWLLDTVDASAPRTYVGVDPAADPDACRALGGELAAHDVRLLVVGDGTARRSATGPGFLDWRAEAFDAAAEAALRLGAPEALLGLDAQLARDLLAEGRAAWQVLAGAALGGARHDWRGTVHYADAPYGVCYLAVSWSRRSRLSV